MKDAATKPRPNDDSSAAASAPLTHTDAAILTLALMVLLAFCAYLGSYLALVQRGDGESNLGFNFYEPAYRYCPRGESKPASVLYRPAHMLDRRLLRPSMWVEKVDLVALLAADLAREGAVGAPNQHLQPTRR